MLIQSSRVSPQPRPGSLQPTKALDAPSESQAAAEVASPDSVLSSPPNHGRSSWLDVVLSEAAVEIPETLLDMSNLADTRPGLAGAAQVGITGMALARSIYCFSRGGLTQNLEGASALGLAVSGAMSFLPGGVALTAGNLGLLGHGASEVALGGLTLGEELSKSAQDRDQRSLAAGVLGVIKGGTSVLPLVAPSTSGVVNWIQLGTIVGKTVLESPLGRSDTR